VKKLYSLDRDESSLSYLGELPGTRIGNISQKDLEDHRELEEERGKPSSKEVKKLKRRTWG